jgi:chorismate synthase
MGSPIALRLDNAAYRKDKSDWPNVMAIGGEGEGIDAITLPRPGHADLTGAQKYGFDDIRPVIDRASARETAMRVACCSIARKLLKELGIQIGSHVVRIGEVGYDNPSEYAEALKGFCASGAESINTAADQSEVRMIDADLTQRCIEQIKAVKKEGDSLGGVYEVVVTGVPVGLGSYVHWDRKLDALLGRAILSIQAQKAVEIGDGMAAAFERGSAVHDPITVSDDGFSRTQNRAGGIEGGMSNGMPIIVRGYMKPIPTLIKPLQTADMVTGETQPTRYERSDVTSVPAASTVAEAVVATEIANALLEKFGGDSLSDIQAYLGK